MTSSHAAGRNRPTVTRFRQTGQPPRGPRLSPNDNQRPRRRRNGKSRSEGCKRASDIESPMETHRCALSETLQQAKKTYSTSANRYPRESRVLPSQGTFRPLQPQIAEDTLQWPLYARCHPQNASRRMAKRESTSENVLTAPRPNSKIAAQ
jgi:hypothetical protein